MEMLWAIPAALGSLISFSVISAASGKERMKHNWFNDLRHKFGGHQITLGRWVDIDGFDGCSFQGKCNYCGKGGLIDSQDNLF